jgi:transcription termination/antitermination protein NusG
MSDTDTDTNEPQIDISDPAADIDDAVTDDVPEAAADDAPDEAVAAPVDALADAQAEAIETDPAGPEAPAEAEVEAEATADEAAADEATADEAAADEATADEAAADEAAADEAAADEAAADEEIDVAEPDVEAAANGQTPTDSEAAEDAADEVITDEELLARPPAESPYDRPGRWFVVHTQSGYEKKVKQNLEARIVSMNAEDAIYEVVIPMEDYVDFRNGKRIVAQRKMFPGYLLVRAALDDQAWFVIRNTPGVTGFVGQGAKPSPLPRRDVESFLMPKGGTEEQVAQRAKPRLEYEIGETVRVREGPFADFSGEVIELNEDQLKLKVLVNIFGRETPVELEFSKVAKL